MTGRADGWIRWTTTGCVALLALIAGTVSYLHMHILVARMGSPAGRGAHTAFSGTGEALAVQPAGTPVTSSQRGA